MFGMSERLDGRFCGWRARGSFGAEIRGPKRRTTAKLLRGPRFTFILSQWLEQQSTHSDTQLRRLS